MSLRFIYGRAGSGKSYYCLKDIKNKIELNCDRPLILIVPEQFSFQSEKNLLSTIGEQGFAKVQVLSFKRMAYRVFNEIGGITHSHINSAGKCMLIHIALEDVKGELDFYKNSRVKQGFTNSLCKTIGEFKRYNVSPEVLSETIENMENENPLKRKLKDINLIYRKFEDILHKSYIDSDDELTILAHKLKDYKGFDNAEIWIDEFETFTPQQYEILKILLKKASKVNVTLTTDCLNGDCSIEKTDLFMPTKITEGKLLKIIEENNISYEKPVKLIDNYRFKDSKELLHLEQHFFSFPYNSYNGNVEDLTLFRAMNPFSEVESTARDIIRLCREKGARFKDIAVVTRDLENYQKIIEVVFSQYGIPYFIDKKRDIKNNPLIIMLSSVVEIFNKGWTYESVFRYLKTGLTGIKRDDIDIIENYVLANGIKGKKWTQEEDWDYRINYVFDGNEEEISDYENQLIKKVNEIRQQIIKPLIKLNSKLKERKNTRDICTAIFEFIEELGVQIKIENWVEEFKIAGKQDKASEYSQIWNIFVGLLDQIVEVMGDENISLNQFVKVLATGIEEYEIGIIPPSLDQVLVGSIEHVKSHDVCMLYILGVNDGIFPQFSKEDEMLTDKDRIDLKNHGVEIAKDTAYQTFEEQFRIYTTFSIPSKYLRLSYSIADFEGKALRPSIIISRIKKIFPNITEKSNVINTNTVKEDMELISRPSPTFTELISKIKDYKDGIKVNDLWWDVYRWYINKPSWEEKCNNSFKGFEYSNLVNKVDEKKIQKLYGLPMQFSASRLETYAACPFAYYVQYGLNAKDRKVYKFEAPDLGSFMHKTIDELCINMEKENITFRELDENWCNLQIDAIVDNLSERGSGVILNSSARYKFMTARLKKTISKSVMLISDQIKKGGFEPLGHEVSFGPNGDLPAVKVDLLEGKQVNLTGRIDRIDKLEEPEGTYFRIIDYKSGNKQFEISDVYYGLQLQLLVYLEAILSNSDKYIEGEAIPGAIFYFHLNDPVIYSKGEESEEKINKEIMKKLKLNGLILKDAKIVREMDRDIDGYSLIVPARINKDGNVSGNSAITYEEFEILRKYVKDTISNLCTEILKGNISISPYKMKENTPCSFCDYKSICGFDSTLKDNRYRKFNISKDKEVWKMIINDVEKKGGKSNGK